MRRKDKEITDEAVIQSIIHKSPVCRLAISDGDHPYVVPLCFGYKDNALYFHSAREGKKLDIIRKNHNVCFEFDIDHEMMESEKACEWGIRYRSVIGFGKASIIDDLDAKRAALDIIMAHYSEGSHSYPDSALNKTIIIRIDIESLTGKQSEY
jgi:nitroimidazol reductase NimA-like FMN-containing flavoprotein (pyridoxamine 5'-phosphate oxidase superfamily)